MGEPGDHPDLRDETAQHWQATSPVGVREPFARAPLPSGRVATSDRGVRQRLTWLLTASVGVIGISALLVACFYWTLFPSLQSLVSSQQSPAQGQASGPGGVRNVTPPANNATTTPLAPADWRNETHSGTNYRFRIDMPAMLTCSHGFFINDFSGMGCDYTYSGAPEQTALQQVEIETRVELLSSSKITDRNICPQGGTPVQLGTGASTTVGWERDQISTTNSEGTVTVNFLLHGIPVEISLAGFGGQQQPFLGRYGEIWHHMLASFTLLPSSVTQAAHPCG